LALARLDALLRAHRLVALDSCIFIYQWEASARYSALTDHIFSSLQRSEFSAVASTITMAELLVHPYREEDELQIRELLGLFSTYPNLAWESPDLAVAVRTAEIRARYKLQTPDAIQAATAIHAQASAFLTNDPIFTRIPDFDTFLLDRFI
jgi:predicted nucleic acid-binding protein